MTAKNELVFRRWLEEVWNKGREEVIEEMFDENGVAVYTCIPTDSPVRGIKQFKAFRRYISQYFLELKVTIEDIISEDEKVTAVCRLLAKKSDESQDTGSITIEVSGLCIVKIRNGKIIEAWNNLDVLNFDKSYDDLLLKPV